MKLNYENLMKTAMTLAKRGIGYVSPNPPVGALIVKNNKIIGQGYHKKYGGPHAEVVALQGLNRKDLEKAILIVTLEPCSHFGKTPPCANLIIESGIKKVVVGVRDKNPKVAGKGIELLRRNGVDVKEGVLEDELRKLYAPFFKYIVEKTPFVTLKFAETLDGKNAPLKGSRYLVSEKTLRYIHKLRFESDAIMVGINTVISDNPSLDIRYYHKKKDLLKVVLDTEGRLKGDEKLFKSRGDVLVYTASSKLKEKGIPAETVVVDKADGRLNIETVMRDLGEKKIQNLLVEGGGILSFELMKNRLVDRLMVILTPYILGGERNLSVSGAGFKTLETAFYLDNYKTKKIDKDLIVEWVRF
ncbi:MAG: bifunctional diaminohydroxyphosphoribosylaminopyrimidine deaminase/5-amino-6-(5-phosphoribosylamino)uracil reductase RibD [Proteobacteria bacterium]|nr:bifunctional diaminohydroxyphosphoribosylaminopyrimidine deaminase/5-amino-6-(5-phosphoribosylamino)uracil reductase RibD [Pseudomonadota bacterium]